MVFTACIRSCYLIFWFTVLNIFQVTDAAITCIHLLLSLYRRIFKDFSFLCLYNLFYLLKKWKMTSSVLLCNNSPSVEHRPIKYISEARSGEVINLIGRWHEGNYFYSNYDQTSGIIRWKKIVHNTILQWHVAVLLSADNTPLVSVDLIMEKNQVILELQIKSL